MARYGILARFAVLVPVGLFCMLASQETISQLARMDITPVASILDMVDMSLHHIPPNVVVDILFVVRKMNKRIDKSLLSVDCLR